MHEASFQHTAAREMKAPVPTWLKVKSQLKAGDKTQTFGPGEDTPSTSRVNPVPTWLKVKSQLKAGDKTESFGIGPDAPSTLRVNPVPTWLKVKSQLKAGEKGGEDFGSGQDTPSPELRRLISRVVQTH